MTRSIIVINVDIRETRVALVEGGVIAELQIERASHRGTVGNVVLGKVTRVLPGMQAAFIDVGQDRSAFLHVEDLIRPDDFEIYLSGGADEQNESFRGTGERKATQQRDDDEDDEDEDEPSGAAATHALNGARPAQSVAAEDDAAEDDAPEDDDAEELVVQARGADADSDEDEDDADDDRPEGAEDDVDEDDDDDDESDDEDESDDDEDEVLDADAAHAAAADAELAEAAGAAGVEEVDDIEEVDVEDLEEDSGPDAAAALADPLSAERDEEVADGEVAVAATVAVRSRQRLVPTGEVAPIEALAGLPGAIAPGDARRGPGSGRNRSRSGRGGGQEASVGGAALPSGRSQGSDGARLGGADNAEPELGRGRGQRPQPGGRGNNNARGRQGTRGRRGRQRGGSNGGGNVGINGASPKPNANEAKQYGGRRAVRGKGGPRHSEGNAPPRVTRSVPITEVVSEGDDVVVQISKEPIGTKGARVTSHVSLPCRYVVYLPTVDHLGISKRIGSARERARLRQVMESLKPARGGLIVRTVAEGLTKKQLKADVGYLIRVWAEVCKRRETAKPAEVLYTELDLVLKVARDLFTDEVKSIVIDDREQYARLVRFVEMFLPERVKDIELYTGSEPIFDAYGIEDEIGRALSRKVPLPSGGSLIVDQAEALTAIDVNTGRYVGKGSKDLEETALKTNLEAVEEIAYQLRFRNIGGLVILDLIDMERHSNREKVWRALETALVKDKAKTTLNRISELGLIEMTRKRTRESLGRMLHEPCFYCDGTGQIQSKATIAYEILRQIGRERHSLAGYSVVVNAHPAIVDFLKTEDRGALDEAERRYARRIELAQRPEYHIEQYDLQGK